MVIPQWHLNKGVTRFCGLSSQVVFHDRENKHDFLKTVLVELHQSVHFSKISKVSLHRLDLII